MGKSIDFAENADNVYRTRDYIVRQCIGIQHDDEQHAVIYSHDTFYRRTPARDRQYETLFGHRLELDGKRLPSNMFARQYVD